MGDIVKIPAIGGSGGGAAKTVVESVLGVQTDINNTAFADSGLSVSVTTTAADQYVWIGGQVAYRRFSGASGVLYLAYKVGAGADVYSYYTNTGSLTTSQDRLDSWGCFVKIVSPGTHTVKLRWATDSGAVIRIYATSCFLQAEY